MAHTNRMIHITQTKLQQLIRHDTRRITEPKKRVISEHSPQTHGPRMQDAFMAEITQAGMAMNDLDALTDEDLPE